MRIKILTFGILRDIIGESTIEKELENGVTIQDLRQELIEHYADLKQYQNYSIAVNETYAGSNYTLKENDVVALIPPVSGG
jgi:MoaD family protein